MALRPPGLCTVVELWNRSPIEPLIEGVTVENPFAR
jgi:hypothetical protein